MSYWEPNPEFYELEKKSKPTAADKFRNPQAETKKCFACDKSVHKTKELVALDKTWHKECFICGVTAMHGCKRPLTANDFQVIGTAPYCEACHDRISKKNGKKNETSIPAKSIQEDEDEFIPPKSSPVVDEEEFIPPKSSPVVDEDEFIPPKSSPVVDEDEFIPPKSSPVVDEEEFIPPKSSPVVDEDEFIPPKSSPKRTDLKIVQVADEDEPIPSPQKQVPRGLSAASEDEDMIPGRGQPIDQDEDMIPSRGVSSNIGDEVPPKPQSNNESYSYNFSYGNNSSPSHSAYGSNSNFENFELPDDFGKTKPPSAADKFRLINDKTKCPQCMKTVYKAEEIQVMGMSWHKLCFTCGGTSDLGCKRKLGLGLFQVRDKMPFCNVCHDKLARVLISKPLPTNDSRSETNSNAPDDEFRPFEGDEKNPENYQYDLSSLSDKPKNPAAEKFRNPNGKYCPQCMKTVYKAEELVALGSTWHQTCFTCGGTGELGCKRKLALGQFQVHNKMPYCGPCQNKIARENNSKSISDSYSETNSNAPDDDFRGVGDSDPKNSEFYQYDLGAIAEKPKNPAAEKFKNAAGKTICPACNKTVYKAEELIALGSTWHQTCFTCGGTGELGCKRKLALGQFQVHDKIPYCKACEDKISRENNSKPARRPSQANLLSALDAEGDFGRQSEFGRPTEFFSGNEFQSFELSDSFGSNKKPSAAAEKFRNAAASAKCPACSKTVYKAEEMIALGATWHQSCFTCGGTGELGCKRRLMLGTFRVHDKLPYCNSCCDRVFRDTQLAIAVVKPFSNPVRSLEADEEDFGRQSEFGRPTEFFSGNEFQSFELSDSFGSNKKPSAAAEKFKNTNKSACPACSRSVYKAEEMIALGATWHQSCFTCGGTGELGCKRRLMLGTFRVHDKLPYCNSCCDRVFRDSVLQKKVERTLTENDGEVEGEEGTEESQKKQSKFKVVVDESQRCPSCREAVFKAEQLVALGAPWHPSCFVCGGTGDQGCKRRLALGAFRGHNKTPYCNLCFDRVARENNVKTVTKSEGYTGDAGEEEEGNTGGDDFQSFELSDGSSKPKKKVVDKFRPAIDESQRCPVCQEAVFKAEQVSAVGSNWHPGCFLCGGTGDQGCRRRLAHGTFRGHNKNPYCDLCFDRVYKENFQKSTFVAPVNTSFSPLPSTVPSSTSESGRGESGRGGGSAREESSDFTDRASIFRKSAPDPSEYNIVDEQVSNRRQSIRMKFSPIVADTQKCPVCVKTVYKTEEIQALGSAWHPSCFTCGGKGDQGCKKKLDLGNFTGEAGNPYCKSCADRIVKEAYSKSLAAASASAPTNNSAMNFNGFVEKPKVVPQQLQSSDGSDFQSFELSDDALKKPKNTPADKFRNLGAGNDGKKCPICSKSVYRAEEVVALNQSFHPACFACGGSGGLGCRRRLGMGEFRGHLGYAYCNTCFDKVVKETIAKDSITKTTPSAPSSPQTTARKQFFEESNSNGAAFAQSVADALSAVEISSPPSASPVRENPVRASSPAPPRSETVPVSPPISSPVRAPAPVPDSSPIKQKSNDSSERTVNGSKYVAHQFSYSSDFDENGLVYFIGSGGHKQEFKNPHTSGLLVSTMSSVFKGAASNLVERNVENVPNYTGNDPYSNFEIDLGVNRRMILNHYTLRHGGSSKGNVLRNWKLQARSDRPEDQWVTLREHKNDTSLPMEPRSTASWELSAAVDPNSANEDFIGYRYFRVTQTGPNSNNNDCLFCAGVEFYGTLYEKQ